MKKDEFLHSVKKKIRFVFDRNEIEKELSQHILDSIEDLKEEGLSDEEAEEQAVAQMGDPAELGIMLNKEHNPGLGYAWLISKFVLFFLILIYLVPVFISFMTMVLPPNIENKEETFEVDLKKDISTFDLEIKDVVITEDGRTMLTFRMWRKYKFSRAGFVLGDMMLFNTDGENIYRGGDASRGFFGVSGVWEFEWPDDDIIVLHSTSGKELRVDLKEYCYE